MYEVEKVKQLVINVRRMCVKRSNSKSQRMRNRGQNTEVIIESKIIIYKRVMRRFESD